MPSRLNNPPSLLSVLDRRAVLADAAFGSRRKVRLAKPEPALRQSYFICEEPTLSLPQARDRNCQGHSPPVPLSAPCFCTVWFLGHPRAHPTLSHCPPTFVFVSTCTFAAALTSADTALIRANPTLGPAGNDVIFEGAAPQNMPVQYRAPRWGSVGRQDKTARKSRLHCSTVTVCPMP